MVCSVTQVQRTSLPLGIPVSRHALPGTGYFHQAKISYMCIKPRKFHQDVKRFEKLDDASTKIPGLICYTTFGEKVAH